MTTHLPTIETATPFDATKLAQLAEITFRDAFARLNNKDDFEIYVARSFTPEKIRSEISDKNNIFFIAKFPGQPDEWAGYAKLSHGTPPGCVINGPAIELSRLYCRQEHLGLGIGKALVESCIDYARKENFKAMWLGSWKENHRGNAFYTKMNFKIVGSTTFALGTDIQEDHIFCKSLA